MKRVPENEYKNYILWAGKNTANRVYPCSIAEGYQAGDIYVNDGADLESVFFWHYCGFGYISGKASGRFLNDIYSEMVSGGKRRLVLITQDADVISYFRDKDVLMDSRAEYDYRQKQTNMAEVSDRFRIEQISPENISGIEGRIVPSFSWESAAGFLENGFGYTALDQGRICAAAFSAAVSSEEIDIGVETRENYRRRGLAAVLTDRMCGHILSLGKKPVWAHSVSNKGSMNTALRCGFVQDRINTVIRKKPAYSCCSSEPSVSAFSLDE